MTISPPWEVMLCVIHINLLLSAEFLRLGGYATYLELYIEFGLLMSTLPLIGILGGRFWPYLMLLPIVAAPIAGKTVRELQAEAQSLVESQTEEAPGPIIVRLLGWESKVFYVLGEVNSPGETRC